MHRQALGLLAVAGLAASVAIQGPAEGNGKREWVTESTWTPYSVGGGVTALRLALRYELSQHPHPNQSSGLPFVHVVGLPTRSMQPHRIPQVRRQTRLFTNSGHLPEFTGSDRAGSWDEWELAND
ncbi:hypothetical protein NMY22_g17422 [Coprinellus aureogranulatus]|nr:hypothetical protein NMY22_g17422 [Coprinellus aureogranulatus]